MHGWVQKKRALWPVKRIHAYRTKINTDVLENLFNRYQCQGSRTPYLTFYRKTFNATCLPSSANSGEVVHSSFLYKTSRLAAKKSIENQLRNEDKNKFEIVFLIKYILKYERYSCNLYRQFSTSTRQK